MVVDEIRPQGGLTMEMGREQSGGSADRRAHHRGEQPRHGDDADVPRARLGRPPRTEIEPLQILAIDARVAGKTLKDISEDLHVDARTVGRWFQ